MKTFVLKDYSRPAKVNYSIPYESLLNAQQLQAVFHDRGPALVVAGAGTGKTRTLIYRLARLVESGVDPTKILLLTFTRKAAEQMLDRAGQILDERCRRVRGGTYHNFCNQILHRFHHLIGFAPNFSILDSDDAADVIHSLRANIKYDKKQSRFPQKSTLQSMFSASVNRLVPLSELIQDSYPQFAVHEKPILELASEYQRFKKAQGLMDFDDMLIFTRDLLLNSPETAAVLSNENQLIMVDEYQDTNKIQADIVRLLSGSHQNVMAVGDDAQGIYAFRGADPANIFRFPEEYRQAKLMFLEENYRSTPSILALANSFLSFAKKKYDKKLFTKNADQGLPGLVKAPDERNQSLFITQMILNLREQGLTLADISVLFRNARDSFDLEIELNKHQIPYIKIGGQKLTEAAHVKDISAYLRVIHNPKDLVAWNRILLLLDGIGPKTAGELVEFLQNQENPLQPGLAAGISAKFIDELQRLTGMLQKAGSEKEMIKALETVISYYLPIVKAKYDDHPKRIKDLEMLQNLSSKYQSLATFLNELALDPLDATSLGANKAEVDEPPLILSTIHSAKGLEWSAVFLINCLDGVIPSAYALKKQEDIDEELRILYVGVTRAKNFLFFTYPAVQTSGYGDYFTKPSRFFDGIGDDLLEPWMLEYGRQETLPEPEKPIGQLEGNV